MNNEHLNLSFNERERMFFEQLEENFNGDKLLSRAQHGVKLERSGNVVSIGLVSEGPCRNGEKE